MSPNINPFATDLRFGWRLLRKQPVFTAVILLTLALGIGVNTAIASVVEVILLDPLPYENASELIALRGSFATTPTTWVAYREFRAWQERSRAFESIAAHRLARHSLRLDGRPTPVIGVGASANLFTMLGTEPLIGRTFTPEEDRFGARPVVCLSYPFWQQRFGGRESVLGEVLEIDNKSFEVIGVMKPDVLYPGDFRSLALWLPLGQMADEDWGWSYETHPGISVTGRLADGANLATARADLERLARELADEHPDTHTGRGVSLRSVLERSFGQLRPRVWALAAAVLGVLMIACVNVANLLLVRGAGRTQELAIRSAVGASRWRILQQLLVESVALALAAAIGGLGVAWATLRGLHWAVDIDSLPAFRELTINGGLLLFTTAVTLFVGLAAGLAPALRGAAASGSETLTTGARDSMSRNGGRLQRSLVVVEIALAVVLSICALLSVRSFHQLVSDDLGFNPESLLTFSFSLPDEGFPAPEQAVFFDAMLARLESLPGIESATTTRPIAAYWSASFDIVGRPAEEKLSAKAFQVSPGYFATLGVKLLRGRAFLPTDLVDAPPVLIVDRQFVATFWPQSAEALGARIRLATDPTDSPGREIVGIVDRAHYQGPHLASEPTFYQPMAQAQEGWGWAVLRTSIDPATLQDVVQAEMTTLEPSLLIDELWTMDDRLASKRGPQRLAALLLLSFAVLAVVLGVVGIYSVISFTVASQRREMGIRQALGARSGDIAGLILRRGLLLTATGLALGLLLSSAGVRLLSSQLYQVQAYDPETWLVAIVTILVAALAACALPARRAGHVHPTAALRDTD